MTRFKRVKRAARDKRTAGENRDEAAEELEGAATDEIPAPTGRRLNNGKPFRIAQRFELETQWSLLIKAVRPVAKISAAMQSLREGRNGDAEREVPTFSGLVSFIDYLPSKRLRKQLHKLVREDLEEMDQFSRQGRWRLVRWRTWMVYTTCAWYALRWPFLAAVWGLIKRITGA